MIFPNAPCDRLRSWTVRAWSNRTVGEFKRVLRISVCQLGWGKIHTFIASVALGFLTERHVGLYIRRVRKIRSIAFARFKRAIALQLDAVHANILKIVRVPLVATREINIAHQTNYN